MKTICTYLIFFLCLPLDLLSQGDSLRLIDSNKNKILAQLKNYNKKEDLQKAELYRRLGEAYENELRPDSAVNYYQKSSSMYKSLGKDDKYYELVGRLGVLYYNLYNYKFAISNLKEVTDYYKANRMYLPYVKSMNQLGLAYSGNNEDDKARQCFIATLEINNDILKDTHLIIENKVLIIQNDIKTGNFSRSLNLALHNNKVAGTFRNDTLMAQNLFLLGKIYYKLNEYVKSSQYLENAEPILAKIGDNQTLQDLYKMLSQVYIELGYKDKIVPTMDKYYSVVEEIKNTEIVKSSQEIAQRFDSEKKDVTIKQLENENELKTLNGKQQRIMIYILIFAFLATILAVYLIYRDYTNRFKTNQIINQQRSELQDKQLMEIEKDVQIKAMDSMLMGQEAERNRIGKDLHDSLGAMLSTIKLQMSANLNKEGLSESPAMKKAKEMIDEACEEVRKISRDMMPITLSKYGLHTALEELVEKYTIEGGPTVIYQAFGINRVSDKDLDLFVFRIVQELVNNSIKHAQATEIIIQINYLEDVMMITVEDDGRGFEYNQMLYQGMGLKNVEYRAQYLKGKFSVESSPGQGTIMVVEIPSESIKHKETSLFSA